MCENETTKPSKSGNLLDAEAWDALRKVGYTEDELLADQPFGPLISSYSRAQAVEDGVLVDVTPIALRAGVRLHTVITCGVKSELCDGKPADFNVFEAVYWLLRDLSKAVRLQKEPSDRVTFKHGNMDLWACVGPGDDPKPVLTVMLEGED